MEDEYSSMSADLRQFIDRTNYTSSSQLMSIPQAASPSLPVPNFFSSNHRPHPQQHPSFLNLTPPPVLHDQQHAVLNSSGSGGGGLLLTYNHHYHEFGSDYSTTNSTTTGAGTTTNTSTPPGQANLCRFDVEAGGGGGVCMSTGGEVGTVRWPRQETLTLLEIRSKLDLRFKEANQKGPLWEEVSRIMSEEHGYERSGKKCREKFENLYKYYKKTKEGKAGKQNGKHYRFFRQLEALYGEQPQRQKQPSPTTTNPNTTSSSHEIIAPSLPGVGNNSTDANSSLPIFDHQITSGARAPPPPPPPPHHGPCPTLRLSDSVISASNHSSLDTTPSSSDGGDVGHTDDDDDIHCNAMQSAAEINNGRDTTTTEMINKKTSGHKRRGSKGWKAKVKEFIDREMSKLVAKQELWLERMMTCIQHKEQERMLKEEEWRKQDGIRMEQQHKIWANERAWIEARDADLLDALQRIAGTREAKDVANDVRQVMLAHQQQRQLLEAQIGHHQQVNAEVPRSNHQDGTNHPPRHDHSMIIRNNHDQAHGQGNNIPLHLELLNRRDDDGTDCYHNKWAEPEITRLIQIRTEMESRFEECGRSSCEEDILWEDIATRMACSGYERNATMCKDKWDFVNKYYFSRKQYCCSSNPNKKKKKKKKKKKRIRKEDWESTTSRSSSSINGSHINDHDHTSSFYNSNQISGSLIGATAQGGRQMVETTTRLELNHDNNIRSSSSPSTSSHDHPPNVINVGPAAGGTAPDNHGMAETYFRFLVGDGGVDNLWENYGLKPNKGGNQ